MAKMKQIIRRLGVRTSILALISSLLVAWIIVQIVLSRPILGLAPIGFMFHAKNWVTDVTPFVFITMSLSMVALILLIVAAALRIKKATMLTSGAVVLCSVPWFITIFFLVYVIPIILVIAVVQIFREEKHDIKTIVRILLPLPYVILIVSLPSFMISI